MHWGGLGNPPCNLPTNVVTVTPHGGRGGLHHKTVPQYHSVNQLRHLVKIFFGAFGAWYFLCFLGQVTVPPQGGGLQKGGGLQEGGGGGSTLLLVFGCVTLRPLCWCLFWVLLQEKWGETCVHPAV